MYPYLYSGISHFQYCICIQSHTTYSTSAHTQNVYIKKGHAVRLCNGIAVCCRVLQCIAVCCIVLQCIALYCNTLQCIAVCCSVLQIRCCSISLSLHLARSFSHCKKGTARLLLRCSNGTCSSQVSFSKRARQLVASLPQVTYRCATIIYIYT